MKEGRESVASFAFDLCVWLIWLIMIKAKRRERWSLVWKFSFLSLSNQILLFFSFLLLLITPRIEISLLYYIHPTKKKNQTKKQTNKNKKKSKHKETMPFIYLSIHLPKRKSKPRCLVKVEIVGRVFHLVQ